LCQQLSDQLSVQAAEAAVTDDIPRVAAEALNRPSDVTGSRVRENTGSIPQRETPDVDRMAVRRGGRGETGRVTAASGVRLASNSVTGIMLSPVIP
jgi:hypothetical protein